MNLMELMNITGICPILAKAEPDAAVPAARALMEGGIPALEVLMRDDSSMGNMERIAKEIPEFLVGAGTIVTAGQAERAIDHGARFIVSPGFSRAVVELCMKKGIPVVPGCVTASEIISAVEYGIRVVKFFPVYELGGVNMLTQLNGPFPDVRFIVTGGLTNDNYLPLVSYKGTLAAGGDWMFLGGNALGERNFAKITENTRKSVYKVLDMRAVRDNP